MEGMIISDNFSTWEWSRVHSNPSCMHSDIKSDSLKGQFFFCKSSWKGEERWTSSEGEEADQGATPSQVWLIWTAGRRVHGCLVFGCFEVAFFSFYWLSRTPTPLHRRHTNIYIQTWPIHTHAHTHTGSGNNTGGRCREMGWKRLPFVLALNYSTCD